MKETDIGERTAAMLRDMGWTVYAEVQAGPQNPICDIVATRGSMVWAIECKAARSIDVIDQASQWLGAAHLVSVAVPPSVRGRRAFFPGLSAWKEIAEIRGIGVIAVREYGRDVEIESFGRVYRRIAPGRLLNRLRDEQQASVPGTAGGGHWTPFRGTCEQLRTVVHTHPGIKMADALTKIKHHYGNQKTAASSLSKWIKEGIVEGLRLERGKLFLAEQVTNP